MSTAPRLWAVVPAAGTGARMAQSQPKQYCEVLGKSVLQHSLDALLNFNSTMHIVVATRADENHWPAGQLDERISLVEGGASRSESVMAGLQALKTQAQADELVFVHDAARPCVSPEELSELHAAACQSEHGALLALPVTDTLKRKEESSEKIETLARESLFQALTPQAFPFELLYRALSEALSQGLQVTDEASAIEQLGGSPRLVMGKRSNIKITYLEDLILAEAILREKAGR